jgi:hypothetical protein
METWDPYQPRTVEMAVAAAAAVDVEEVETTGDEE